LLDRFEVEGGRRLQGTIGCAGSKNAALPLMAAALMADGITVLENVPDLQDIHTMAMVLRVIGADVRLENGVLTVDAANCNSWDAPYELVRKMRASFYVLGPLLYRFGQARVSLPGGCALGPRPVDLHIKGVKRLGCDVQVDAGYVVAKAERLHGARVLFDMSSVGATGNVMMAALAAEGVTVIDNAACEPEIVDLAQMLVAMGAEIRGVGTNRLEVAGPARLKPVHWKVIPDRIVAGTYIIAGAVTGGRVTVTGCRPDHLTMLLDKLDETGVHVEIAGNSVTVTPPSRRLTAVDVTTAVYPGFPTDLQAPWTSLMSLAEGTSVITDTIYSERFAHIPELMRLGANIRKDLNSIHIEGVDKLTGASVMCSDIRAGAGLVLAALAAEGRSDVLRVYHLDRGYERMEESFTQLGGKVSRFRE
jgi:UDP-N-acetylglucosamine 1-carboxyvinyltransferase